MKNNSTGKLVAAIGFYAIALFCIVVSIICIDNTTAVHSFNYGDFDYAEHTSYGGDAYTGIQNAAADTANNVAELADVAADYSTDIIQAIYTVTSFAAIAATFVFAILATKDLLCFLESKKSKKSIEVAPINQEGNLY